MEAEKVIPAADADVEELVGEDDGQTADEKEAVKANAAPDGMEETPDLEESNGSLSSEDNKEKGYETIIEPEENSLQPQEKDKKMDVSSKECEDKVESSSKEDEGEVEVSPKEDEGEVEVSPKEDESKVEVSPKEEDKKVEVSPKEEDKKVEVSPKEEEKKVEVSPKEEDKKVEVSPKDSSVEKEVVDEKLPSFEKGDSTADQPGVESSAVEENQEPEFEEDIEIDQLETINQKRQEEKELFQKLIDDVTRLERELSNKSSHLTEMQMNLDVCSIELDTEKDKSEELAERIKELEKDLAETETKLSIAKRAHEEASTSQMRPEETIHAHSHTVVSEEDKVNNEEEIKDLHQKIRKLAQDDEVKTQRVAHLETEVSDFLQLMNRLEEEIGKERLEALRQNQNGVGQHGDRQDGRARTVQGNAVNPDSHQSSVCAIL